MHPHMTFKQYRRTDLFFFALILTVSEALIITAGNRWFRDQLYTVSAVAAVTAIVLMRWGKYGIFHAVLGGIVFCIAGGGNVRQLAIYGIGNALAGLGLFYIRHFGHKRIRDDFLLTVLYALCIQLLMQLGRALIALLTGAPPGACLNFFTTDALSGLFTSVIVWIAARLDGMLEDQKTYLLRLNREREESNKGGY
ncbi:MAG: hypothetical protein IJ242_00850 [Clostridia bacterium]|nr:hypothetical protein [Clostridia bacterium]